ncbi:MAG: arginase family protein [bacterium]
MQRPIAIIGAPSSIGIRPYDTGEPRHLDRAPAALRERGLVSMLDAHDLGDVVPGAYVDLVRTPGRVRNEQQVLDYSLAIADRVAAAMALHEFPLVIGGDCSIVLGATLGARAAARGAIGLAYVDAHADFATPDESYTGSAASMCLGMVAGRGDTPLARLSNGGPLVAAPHIALIGRRDLDEPWYGHDALNSSGALDLPHTVARAMGYGAAASAALERLTQSALSGFWVHLDADVIDPAFVPAVDSPLPGGPNMDELGDLLLPLVQHPKALGLELTIYDPFLDPDGSSAAHLVNLLARILGSSANGAR